MARRYRRKGFMKSQGEARASLSYWPHFCPTSVNNEGIALISPFTIVSPITLFIFNSTYCHSFSSRSLLATLQWREIAEGQAGCLTSHLARSDSSHFVFHVVKRPHGRASHLASLLDLPLNKRVYHLHDRDVHRLQSQVHILADHPMLRIGIVRTVLEYRR